MAAEASVGRLTSGHLERNFTVQPPAAWVRLCSSTNGDSRAAIVNPYANSGFTSSEYKEVHDSGGAVLLTGKHSGTLHILPLFTSGTATATLQLFGFDHVETNKPFGATAIHQALLPSKSGGGQIALGVPYLLSRDDEDNSSPAGFALSSPNSETISLGFEGPSPFPASSGGTTYYVGYSWRMEVSGFWAIYGNLHTVSAGSAIVLARTI